MGGKEVKVVQVYGTIGCDEVRERGGNDGDSWVKMADVIWTTLERERERERERARERWMLEIVIITE